MFRYGLESDAEAVHHIVGVLVAIEAVAHVEEEALGEKGLERELGVDTTHIVALFVEVYTYAGTYGKDWSLYLATHREAYFGLLPKRRATDGCCFFILRRYGVEVERTIDLEVE